MALRSSDAAHHMVQLVLGRQPGRAAGVRQGASCCDAALMQRGAAQSHAHTSLSMPALLHVPSAQLQY